MKHKKILVYISPRYINTKNSKVYYLENASGCFVDIVNICQLRFYQRCLGNINSSHKK